MSQTSKAYHLYIELIHSTSPRDCRHYQSIGLTVHHCVTGTYHWYVLSCVHLGDATLTCLPARLLESLQLVLMSTSSTWTCATVPCWLTSTCGWHRDTAMADTRAFHQFSLKMLVPLSAILLLLFFSCCLMMAAFRQNGVKPLYYSNSWKGDSSLPSNYRPISLTCTTCKIMEAIIKDQRVSYLVFKGLISRQQHAFIKNIQL